MSPNTLFRTADPLEPQTIDEAVALVEQANFEQEATHAEGCELHYIPEAQEFEGEFDGRKARFTKSGFLRFCGTVGVPKGFAEKVPNELLLTNVNTLLEGFQAKKLKMIYRNGVVVNAIKPGRCWLPPKTTVEFLRDGLRDRKLVTDRIIITDDGIVANAYESPTSQFDLGDDPFDLGIRLDYGYEKQGLLKSGFFSRRHRCLNVAYAISGKTMRENIRFERIRGTEASSMTFARFHEKFVPAADLIVKMRTAHKAIQGMNLMDEEYCDLYRQLSKVVGHEPALGVFQVEEARHEFIVQGVKTRKAAMEFDQSAVFAPMAVEGLELYELFNKLTALGQAYKGTDRLFLEELGGSLLPL